MTDKEIFIKIIQTEIFDRENIYAENYPDEFEPITPIGHEKDRFTRRN